MAVGPFGLEFFSKSNPTQPVWNQARLTARWAVALAVTAWFTVRPNLTGPNDH
jgi:hypothetical protein